eukprot:859227_1
MSCSNWTFTGIANQWHHIPLYAASRVTIDSCSSPNDTKIITRTKTGPLLSLHSLLEVDCISGPCMCVGSCKYDNIDVYPTTISYSACGNQNNNERIVLDLDVDSSWFVWE